MSDEEVTLVQSERDPSEEQQRRARQLTLMAGRRAADLRASLSLPGVESQEERGPAPLSFAQERLMFVEQVEGDAVHHNDGLLLLLRGPLHRAALEAAVAEIVDRHSVLRSAFSLGTQGWQQIPTDRVPGAIPVTVLEGAALDPLDVGLQQAVEEELSKPLDIGQGVDLRARLFVTGTDEAALSLVVHHLVCDLWSLEIFARELSEGYSQRVLGEARSPKPLPMQYADYAHEQRRASGASGTRARADFWRDYLDGAPPEHSLPVIGTRARRQQFRGALERTTFPVAEYAVVTALARESGLTSYMALMAAFQYVVSRRSGASDVVVLSPVATRTKPEHEQLIGCFLNMLPVRVQVKRDDTFRSLAEGVRTACLRMWDHQDVPFEEIVRTSAPLRSSSHQPLSQLAFALQNTPSWSMRLEGLQVEVSKLDSGRSRMDLSVWLYERPDGLHGEWEYDVSLFERTQVLSLVNQFHALLRQLARNPDVRLADVDLLSDGERQLLLDQGLGGVQPEKLGHDLKTLLEERVAESRDRVAVTVGSKHLTYGELDERSNRLARLLAQHGARKDELVAVCLPRGFDEVVAILAVVKTGAAYVPLSVDGPPARRDAVLRASRPVVVLSRGELADEVWSPDLPVIDLDDVEDEVQALDPSPLTCRPDPLDLAYVMFTSGSTGTPKGVQVTHEGFCNRMLWAQSDFPLGPEDRVLRKAASTFDVSVDELFRALLNGAASVQMPERRGFDPAHLVDVVEQHAVTDMDVSPTALGELVRSQDLKRLSSLRKLVSGVEALSGEAAQQVLAELDVELFNIYGPTETSVSCLRWRCTAADGLRPVPIGLPMSNVRTYVLDRQLNLLPHGVDGELYVGGAGLARGYLGDPRLTGERFVPDPFTSVPGARMYRTGDRVRRDASGALHFLGRMDEQLNIRGYRVEPAEVEAVLRKHPDVAGVAVVPVSGPRGTATAAYFTAARELPEEELRPYLRGQLPEYMLPAYLVQLPALPLNAHGKLDRESLPTPRPRRAAGEAEERGLTSTEEVLLGIWKEALAFEELNVDDDFFYVGGDSVTATRIVAKARETFGCELEVVAIFDSPTVAGLAERLDRSPLAGLAVGPDATADA